MKAVCSHLGTLVLLFSLASAQSQRAALESVTAVRDGADVRVDISLSSAVTPAAETAAHPDRILIDLPDTSCPQALKDLPVNANGVRRVRVAQHSTDPVVTRIVVDLDAAHLYSLKTDGARILLTVSPVDKARHGAPAAAASGNLIGALLRKHGSDMPASDAGNSAGERMPVPPPSTASAAPATTAATPTSAVPPPRPTPAPGSQPAIASPDISAGQASFTQNQIATATAESASAAKPSEAPAEPNVPPSGTDAGGTAIPTPAIAPPPPADASTMIARSDDPSLRTVFKVKYVAEGVAYLEGGRAQGLAEGMKLEIEDSNLPAKQGDSASAADPRVVAELVVSGVAETSAVTDIHSPKRPVKVGDLAYLSTADTEALVAQRTLSTTRQYSAVTSFTENDTLDEEAREEIPRPPLPSINRARGRIGFDTIETFSHGTSSVTSTDVGMVFRGDITRIGGTFWNLSGYWRGEITKASAASQQTLQNLLNRTYHLNMNYDNPNSTLVAGFGRLFLPWAPSLDTIDGGYIGRRLSKGATVGMFAGSTPDPSSWDYSPDRVIAGSFINFQGGEFNGFHYSTTSGAGINMVNWSMNNPFLFFEDSLSYKRTFAIYESAQLDSPKGNTIAAAPGPGLGRNFFTFRVSPHPKVEIDFNYNYLRDIPTFNPTLAVTGLLDKYLFQGFSAGGRVQVWNQVWLSTNLGKANGTGDSSSSLNQMYGITAGRLPWLKMRADAHYARFSSSFGTGDYKSFSLSKQMSDRLRLEVLLGQQNFASQITTNTRSRFVTGTVETTLGPHYYLQGNFTTNRGDMSYDQVMFSIGYRFDNRRKGE